MAERQREQISDPALAEARFLTASDQGAFVTANKDRIVEPNDYGQHNGVIKLLTWQARWVKQRSATQLALDGN